MNDLPDKAAEFIRENAAAYGNAKGRRVHLEEFRKSKKALLMKDALARGIEAANAQEREAYADKEYRNLLLGLAAAIEDEETLRWQLEAARLEIEIWRTMRPRETSGPCSPIDSFQQCCSAVETEGWKEKKGPRVK